jgi:hypothetical protein
MQELHLSKCEVECLSWALSADSSLPVKACENG